jgi:hypothetical protein
MQGPIFELRKRGIPLSSYIDDALTAARTFLRCALQSAFSAIFMGALGAYLGLPKCKLTSKQVQKWRGFLIDTCAEMFVVGEAKIEKVKAVLREATRAPSTYPRALAKLAGKLISMSPAVLSAALYSRNLYQAIKGRMSWDQVFPTPVVVKQTAEFWLLNIDKLNGRKWWPRLVSLKVVMDASGVGYGGFVHEGQKQIPFTGTFSKQEASSFNTAREMRGYAAADTVVAQ